MMKTIRRIARVMPCCTAAVVGGTVATAALLVICYMSSIHKAPELTLWAIHVVSCIYAAFLLGCVVSLLVMFFSPGRREAWPIVDRLIAIVLSALPTLVCVFFTSSLLRGGM